MNASVRATAALAAVGVLLFALERFLPLRRSRVALLRRLFVNAAISALAFTAALGTVGPTVSTAMEWTSQARLGLLRLDALPPAAGLVATFLLMDLLFYYWHLLNHAVPLLWRFHNVHHIDPDLDVTTAFRFHFGEIALSAGFRVVQIVVVGPSAWTYATYELAFQANTLFHHSNVRLPIRVERTLNRLLVTPRMHGIHHSQVRRENRSNYGVVFPWWDRLHRTLVLNVPQSRLAIGIAGYARVEDNGLWHALSLPFRRQRDYWTHPDGTPADRARSDLDPDRSRLAE
jgi:sterol desaturase/sphingolipid hydroxylase (fatty acid hydroxylase superfamily)